MTWRSYRHIKVAGTCGPLAGPRHQPSALHFCVRYGDEPGVSVEEVPVPVGVRDEAAATRILLDGHDVHLRKRRRLNRPRHTTNAARKEVGPAETSAPAR